MKRTDQESPRYPQSAELFKFCKEALAIKHNFEVKVIDQHVGAMLGFDPADCSHWKKGKKNIKSLQTVNTLAAHLQIDPRIIADLVTGRAALSESLQEFKGYGVTQPSQKYYEELKREYFKDPTKFALDGQARSLDEVTQVDTQAIAHRANEILQQAQVKACPVLIPEILAVLPSIKLSYLEHNDPDVMTETVSIGREQDLWTITVVFPKQLQAPTSEESAEASSEIQPPQQNNAKLPEMRPHLRFMIAKAIGKIMLCGDLPVETLNNANDELVDAQSNLFASRLLMPTELFALSMREVDDSRDIVQQLAEIFWMSRSLVNLRIRDHFKSLS